MALISETDGDMNSMQLRRLYANIMATLAPPLNWGVGWPTQVWTRICSVNKLHETLLAKVVSQLNLIDYFTAVMQASNTVNPL